MTDDSSLPCSQQLAMAPIMSHIISALVRQSPRPSLLLLQVYFLGEGSLDYNIKTIQLNFDILLTVHLNIFIS